MIQNKKSLKIKTKLFNNNNNNNNDNSIILITLKVSPVDDCL